MKNLILAFVLVFSGTSFALAQHSGTPQEQQACSRDASRFCRKQLGDDGAVQACLQQNRNRLTAACQKVFRSHGM
jgi:Cysteine rich repeat